MSCWICDEAHIRYLVEAHHQLVTPATFEASDLLGQMLWRENHRSVNYRYNEKTKTPKYRHMRLLKPLDMAQVIVSAESYNYQSNEHPGWKRSKAKKVVEQIIRAAAWKLAERSKTEWALREEHAPANPHSRPTGAGVLPLGLAKAENLLGKLSPEARNIIIALLEQPSETTWDRASGLIINGQCGGTLWAAVRGVDPTFPGSKPYGGPWPRVPTREILVEAINRACGMT